MHLHFRRKVSMSRSGGRGSALQVDWGGWMAQPLNLQLGVRPPDCHPILLLHYQPSLTEICDTVTSRHLIYSFVIWDTSFQFFRAKSTNFKLILKRRDEAATFFPVAVCLQSSAPALNLSVNCHNFSESKVKVETGGQRLSFVSYHRRFSTMNDLYRAP